MKNIKREQIIIAIFFGVVILDFVAFKFFKMPITNEQTYSLILCLGVYHFFKDNG